MSVRLRKPPLLYWLQAASMSVLGVTAFAARLPTALATLGCAGVVYHVGRRTYDGRAGTAGALCFLAFPGMLYGAHGGAAAVTDTTLALFGSLFVWLTWRGRDRPRLLVPAGVFAGLAVMTKGIAAGVFVVVLLPVVLRFARSYYSGWTLAAVASAVAVALPWHLYAYLAHRDAFVRQYLLADVAARIGGELTDPPIEPVLGFMNYPYLRHAIEAFLPPFPYALPAFGIGLLAGIRLVATFVRRDGPRVHRDKLLLVWWVVAVPLTFAVGGGNQPWYLLPMYLPGAVLVGYAVAWVAGEVPGLVLERTPAGGLRSGATRAASIPRGARSAVYLAGCLALVAGLVAVTGPPIVEPYDHEQRALGEAIAETVPGDATVYVRLGEAADTRSLLALSFYANRRLERASLAAMGSSPEIEYVIVPFGAEESLDRDHRVVARGPKNGISVVAFE